MRKKREKKGENSPPPNIPKPIEIEDIEPQDAYKDREEMRFLFREQLEQIRKDQESDD